MSYLRFPERSRTLLLFAKRMTTVLARFLDLFTGVETRSYYSQNDLTMILDGFDSNNTLL